MIEQTKLHIAHTYVLLNTSKVISYVQEFEVCAHAKYPHILDVGLSKYRDMENEYFRINVVLFYTSLVHI